MMSVCLLTLHKPFHFVGEDLHFHELSALILSLQFDPASYGMSLPKPIYIWTFINHTMLLLTIVLNNTLP